MTLYAGNVNGVDSLLFGNFLGITLTQVVVLAAVAAVALAVLGTIGRPLLFATVDPETAQSRGVPVQALSVVFLVLLGVAAAETSQITGSLLVFALLVLPAATAQVLTARPARSLALAVVLALGGHLAGLWPCRTSRRTRSASGSPASPSAPTWWRRRGPTPCVSARRGVRRPWTRQRPPQPVVGLES